MIRRDVTSRYDAPDVTWIFVATVYSLMRQFTRFPETANRRASLSFLIAAIEVTPCIMHRPNIEEMERKGEERKGRR